MRKKVSTNLFLILLFILISCSNPEKKTSQKEKITRKNGQDALRYIKEIDAQKQNAIDDFCNSLPLEEKIAQMFIINLQGNSKFKPVERLNDISNASNNSNDNKIVPGGYIFFSYNIAETPEEIINFTDDIKRYCQKNQKIIPFISTDQEGGNVNRLRNITGPLPSQKRVSENLSPEDAGRLYALQAKQMRLLGFNMNLAPVTEIEDDSNSNFLNGRSFGKKNQVVEYSKECINAYQDNGILTVLKHFPGNTNTDPHTGLPEILYDTQTLSEMTEPFEILAKSDTACILMSHARTREYDSENPACLSEYWITQILRQKYNFEGIIFSDDIFMDALAKNGYPPETAVIKAVEAGINCIMISEKRIAGPAKVLYQKAIENPSLLNKIDVSVKKIIETKLKAGILVLTEENGKYSVKSPEFLETNDGLIAESTENQYQKTFGQTFINKTEVQNKEEKLKDFLALKEGNIKFYFEKF